MLKDKLKKIKESGFSDKESLVALAWLAEMEKHWKKCKISRHGNCDAYVSHDGKGLLIEFKSDVDMEDDCERAKVIAQGVAYYKRFLEKGFGLVDVLFVADVNECFALHVNSLNKHVGLVDEELAPSSQWKNAELTKALTEDPKLRDEAIVYHVDDPDFDPQKILDAIKAMQTGIVKIVPITEGTLKKGFDYFCSKVVKDASSMTANEIVGRYYAFIKGEGSVVKGKLVGLDGFSPCLVDEVVAKQFKSRFGALDEKGHQELERLYDTLIGDAERRRNGQFFTPKVWVDESHKRIAMVLGQDWEKSCLTWDSCCGTKSLSRDYEYDDLWLSTLDENELKCSSGLSSEAKKAFVFDFLNGSLTTLPKGLIEELKGAKNKVVVFHLNPPYGQATSGTGKQHKKDVSKTETQRKMANAGMGKAANELTVQFLFRILEIVKTFKLKKVCVGLFSNPAWLTGDACEKFREEWLKVFRFQNGFGFRSEEFQGVKEGWAINFSVWKNF